MTPKSYTQPTWASLSTDLLMPKWQISVTFPHPGGPNNINPIFLSFRQSTTDGLTTPFNIISCMNSQNIGGWDIPRDGLYGPTTARWSHTDDLEPEQSITVTCDIANLPQDNNIDLWYSVVSVAPFASTQRQTIVSGVVAISPSSAFPTKYGPVSIQQLPLPGTAAFSNGSNLDLN